MRPSWYRVFETTLAQAWWYGRPGVCVYTGLSTHGVEAKSRVGFRCDAHCNIIIVVVHVPWPNRLLLFRFVTLDKMFYLKPRISIKILFRVNLIFHTWLLYILIFRWNYFYYSNAICRRRWRILRYSLIFDGVVQYVGTYLFN